MFWVPNLFIIHTEIFVGHVVCDKAELEDIDLAHPKTFFYF
jgi:hypothetical protein